MVQFSLEGIRAGIGYPELPAKGQPPSGSPVREEKPEPGTSEQGQEGLPKR